MKSLRQLLLRQGQRSSQRTGSHRTGRRQRTESAGPGNRSRRLSRETLERRVLLAGDALAVSYQNPWNQFDVNNDYAITARDALGVINYLGRGGEAEAGGGDSQRMMFYDVNGDSEVTATDALSVINALGSGEGQDTQLIELLLTARQTGADAGGINDFFDQDLIGPQSVIEIVDFVPQRIVPNANEPINVEVGEVFDIEVSFDDLRLLTNRRGAFKIVSDLTFSEPDAITPVLFDTQQIFIEDPLAVYTPQQLSEGTITFSIPELPPGVTQGVTATDPINLLTFATNTDAVINSVLQQFGYDLDDYFFVTPTKVQDQDVTQDDTAYEFHFTNPDFRNLDLPDISVQLNGTPTGGPAFSTLNVLSDSIEPFVLDGSEQVFNPEAIKFNLNLFSRTFDDNKRFYDLNVEGEFDSDSGFRGLTGIGKINGDGIRGAADNGYPPGPFDAYSFSVFVNRPVSGLTVTLSPNEDDGPTTESVLLYGEDERIPIDNTLVAIEGLADTDERQNGKAVLVINATDPNQGNPPVAGDGALAAFDEGSSSQALDLSTLITGGTATSVTTQTTLPGTVTVGAAPGFALTYTPADDDENTNGTITYTATNEDGSDSGTITVTINPVNDAPIAVDDNGPFSVQSGATRTFTHAELTANDDPGAADESGDTLTAVPVGTMSANGGTITSVGTGIQYTAPNGGFSGTDTFTYRTNDGVDDSANTATVTITVTAEPVDPPTAANGSMPAFNEGSIGTIDLAGLLGGGDPDSVTVTTQGSLGNATIGAAPNYTLTYTPSDADHFGSDSIIYTVTNSGGSDTGTISITINPVNDPPVAVAKQFSTPENTPLQISFAQLMAGDQVGPANEIPRDTLSVINISDPANTNASIDQNGNITYNPPTDFFGTDTFTYTISDGSPDGALTDTATVTITITEGPNNLPTVDGPLVEEFDEDDSFTTISQQDLLAGAEDIDDDDLSVRNLTRTSGNAAGISIVGNTLQVNPGANGALTTGQTASAVYSYEIFDGRGFINQTITINIAGVNDPPSVGFIPQQTAFSGGDAITIDVLAVADAGSGEDQPLMINTATLSNNAAGVLSINGVIEFDPDPNFEGIVTVNYTIGDGEFTDDGSFEISVLDFEPSFVGGYVFIDEIENIRDVIDNDAIPFRDGHKDPGEKGLGSAEIRLVGNGMTWTTITDIHGAYHFDDVAPGNYTVMYDAPSSLVPSSFAPMSISIGTEGGVTMDEMNFPVYGLTPVASTALDFLAINYLDDNGAVDALSNGGREGGIVSLDGAGRTNFLVAGEGFEGVKYAEVRALDGAGSDAALLAVLNENGDVMRAFIPQDRVIFSTDGSTMRFFGAIEDFDFVPVVDNVETADGFRNAVDQIFGDN